MARVAFCQDTLVEYMGFMSMAAVLKQAGHVVEVFFDDQTDEGAFLQELQDFHPDIVGFSLLSPTVPWALARARELKRRMDTVTIFGNVHAILQPDLIEREGVDIVCVGEGEVPLLELAQRIDAGQSYQDISSFTVKTPQEIIRNPLGPVADIENLPFMDGDLYDKYDFFRNSPYFRFTTGRGCPFSCTFCLNPFLRKYYGAKDYLRKMTPERAIRELEYHVARRKPKHIFFIDEVFWVKISWMREFLALYRERIGLKFTANFRPGPIDEEDIKLLAASGAECLIVATETGSEHQRKETFNKPISDKGFFRLGDMLHRNGIKFVSGAFFGIPGDTVEDHLARLSFYRRLRPTYLYTTFLQPYPGTRISMAPDVLAAMPDAKDFDPTVHHDMYLNLPDRTRLVNLKKIYFLVARFPTLQPLFVRLIKARIPVVFDLLFLFHFSYYAFVFEKVSFRQFCHHVKQFGILPFLRKVGMTWPVRPQRRVPVLRSL
jgi:anaerobic magnesium-protoporphyrin IX monomethyl ester cyclase